MSLQSNRRRQLGFSLLEVSVSAVIVGVLLVAALQSAGSAISGQFTNSQQSRAQHLAQELISEILQKAYREVGNAPVFGPEAGETNGASRQLFDDVDDYHNWLATPPVAADGTPLADANGWSRAVTVAYVQPDDLTTTSASDNGVKRISVSVSFNNRVLVTMTTVVTQSMQHVPHY